MLTKEQEMINEQALTHEFLGKLASLVNEYRTQIPMGPLCGALEIVKMRLFYEGNKQAIKQFEEEKGQE